MFSISNRDTVLRQTTGNKRGQNKPFNQRNQGNQGQNNQSQNPLQNRSDLQQFKQDIYKESLSFDILMRLVQSQGTVGQFVKQMKYTELFSGTCNPKQLIDDIAMILRRAPYVRHRMIVTTQEMVKKIKGMFEYTKGTTGYPGLVYNNAITYQKYFVPKKGVLSFVQHENPSLSGNQSLIGKAIVAALADRGHSPFISTQRMVVFSAFRVQAEQALNKTFQSQAKVLAFMTSESSKIAKLESQKSQLEASYNQRMIQLSTGTKHIQVNLLYKDADSVQSLIAIHQAKMKENNEELARLKKLQKQVQLMQELQSSLNQLIKFNCMIHVPTQQELKKQEKMNDNARFRTQNLSSLIRLLQQIMNVNLRNDLYQDQKNEHATQDFQSDNGKGQKVFTNLKTLVKQISTLRIKTGEQFLNTKQLYNDQYFLQMLSAAIPTKQFQAKSASIALLSKVQFMERIYVEAAVNKISLSTKKQSDQTSSLRIQGIMSQNMFETYGEENLSILRDFDLKQFQFQALNYSAAEQIFSHMIKSPILQFVENMMRYKQDGRLNSIKEAKQESKMLKDGIKQMINNASKEQMVQLKAKVQQAKKNQKTDQSFDILVMYDLVKKDMLFQQALNSVKLNVPKGTATIQMGGQVYDIHEKKTKKDSKDFAKVYFAFIKQFDDPQGIIFKDSNKVDLELEVKPDQEQ